MALTQKLDFITKGLQFKIKVAYNSGYDHTKERATSIESYQPWYRKDVTWMEHPAGSDPNEVVYIQDGEAGLISYAESFASRVTGMLRPVLTGNVILICIIFLHWPFITKAKPIILTVITPVFQEGMLVW